MICIYIYMCVCVVSLPAELCAPFHCRAHLILLLAVLAISCSHSRRIGCMQLCRNWLTFTTVNSGRYLVEVKCQVTGVDSRDQFYASKSYKTTHTGGTSVVEGWWRRPKIPAGQ